MAKNIASDLIISGIGACVALPAEKKQKPYVMVVYTVNGRDLPSFVALPLPAKQHPYARNDFLKGIGRAEKTSHVTYTDAEGRQRDICLVRPQEGTVVDVASRDSASNKFKEGFAEVAAVRPPVSVQELPAALSPYCRAELKIEVRGCTEKEGSYAYALANAYNACVLGRLFAEKIELCDAKGAPVKMEIRTAKAADGDESVLYFTPNLNGDGEVNYYQSEDFSFIDGRPALVLQYYKVTFNTLLGYYTIEKKART